MDIKITDTIIKRWFLVSFENDDEIVGKVLWGIVIEDKKLRWRENNFVCTSKVIEEVEKQEARND